jgi:hypothetical protein
MGKPEQSNEFKRVTLRQKQEQWKMVSVRFRPAIDEEHDSE